MTLKKLAKIGRLEGQSNQSTLASIMAVLMNGESIKRIPQTEMNQIISVLKDAMNIRYIDNPSDLTKKIAVKRNPMAIHHIEKPSLDLMIIAVMKSGLNIAFIKDAPDYVKYLAVCQNIDAVKYIENPSSEIRALVSDMKLAGKKSI